MVKKIYRTLLAEDDIGTVEFVTAALQRYNFVIKHAAEGRTAVRYLSEESFDLLLCDVMMPYVDGFKALEQAHEKKIPMPPVIMLTALNDPESVIRAKKLGAAGYLAKPCTAPQLLAKVKSILHLEDADLADKNTMPFVVNTSVSHEDLVITLNGCPDKIPMGEFMKAVNAAGISFAPFRGAQIIVKAEFSYDVDAFAHLTAMAGYLQKTYHISKPNIRFSGAFFEVAEATALATFKQDFVIFEA